MADSKVKDFVTRCAFGTIYYADTDPELLIAKIRDWKVITYAVLGREMCPTTGRMHLQYYIEFTYPMARTTFWNRLGLKCDFEARHASASSASLYCKKGEQSHAEWDELHENGPNYGLNQHYWEWGSITAQGKPSVITIFCEKLRGGYTMKQCASDDPDTYIRFHKGIKDWHNLVCIDPRNGVDAPVVHAVYGAAGTGKSKQVHDRYSPDDTYYWNAGMGNWFDGYNGEKKVVLEEFRGQIPFAQLMSMLDRYCCKVPVKGSMREFCATEIVLVSPTSPDKWYKHLAETREAEEEGGFDNLKKQLFRRFSRVHNLNVQADPGLRAEAIIRW